MRVLLALWLGPIAGFWAWHLMCVNGVFFSRDYHDEVFRLYGLLLHIDPETIPALFAHALMTDAVIVAAVIGFRKRRAIAALYRSIRARASKGDPALLEG